MMLFHNPKRTLKKLLREREEMYWKNRFDMQYLFASEPEVFATNPEALGKEFDKLEGRLLDIQGKYDAKEKQVKDWNLPKEKEATQLKEIIDKKEAERKPLIELIRPLDEKIKYADQIRGLMEKCEEKDLELQKYIIILKWKLKIRDYDYPVLTGEEFFSDILSKKSTLKLGNNVELK